MMDLKWDEWRGSLDGRKTMWIKRLMWFPVGYSWRRKKVLGVRIDLHKFVGADDPECFHTHPAWAMRIVLWGGYYEDMGYVAGYRACRPFTIGIIKPSFAHRVAWLLNGRSSYSLWVRGPICAEVKLIGDGWKKQKATTEGLGDPYNAKWRAKWCDGCNPDNCTGCVEQE